MLESRAAASFVVTRTNERSRQMGSARTEGTAKTIEIVAKAIHMTKVLLIVSPPPAEQRTFGNFDAPLPSAPTEQPSDPFADDRAENGGPLRLRPRCRSCETSCTPSPCICDRRA